PDLRTVFPEGLSPQKILNDNGQVYLADSLNGIFVFDNYGSYRRKIPLVNWQSIAVNREQVICTSGPVMSVYNTSTLLQHNRNTPPFAPYYHSFTTGNKFILFSPTRLQVYQFAL